MSDYQVRDPEAEATLKELGKLLKNVMPKNMGFTLLMFDYGDKGNMFYISSAQRKDMIDAMKEFIERNTH